MLADEVRRARVGDTVTYSRVVELAQVPRVPAACLRCRRCRGADLGVAGNRSTTPKALIAEARMLAGPQLLTGFSLADIADRHWGKLVDVLKRLKRAGLDAIAEAPVDRLHDAEDALRACEDAGLAGSLPVAAESDRRATAVRAG